MTIFAERFSLEDLTAHGSTMDPIQAVSVACDVLRTLSEDYHSVGMAHGAVTPASVMVYGDGTAALLNPMNFDTDFIAPEIIEGAEVRPAADVYAVAAFLTDLLVGHTQRPLSLVTVHPTLRPVLGMALVASPAWRYTNASQFLVKLESAAAEAFGAGWRTERAELAGSSIAS